MFNSPRELLCIRLFNYIVSLLPVMNNLPVRSKCCCWELKSEPGSRESSVSHRHRCLFIMECIFIAFQSDTMEKNGTVTGELKRWGSGTKKERGNEELGVWRWQRCSLWEHWRSLIKISTSQRPCLYVSEHVLYVLTLFAVSPVLAGRFCLCVALSHHLLLARLLISVLLISCPASFSLSGVRTHVDYILCFVVPPSIHPSLQPATYQPPNLNN